MSIMARNRTPNPWTHPAKCCPTLNALRDMSNMARNQTPNSWTHSAKVAQPTMPWGTRQSRSEAGFQTHGDILQRCPRFRALRYQPWGTVLPEKLGGIRQNLWTTAGFIRASGLHAYSLRAVFKQEDFRGGGGGERSASPSLSPQPGTVSLHW